LAGYPQPAHDTIFVFDPDYEPRDHASTPSRSGSENPTNDDIKLAKETAEKPIKEEIKPYGCPFPGCPFRTAHRKSIKPHSLTRR
jgi:hypothetical protein